MTREKTNYPSQQQQGGPRGMGQGLIEKPKSFWGTMLKLARYCKSYLPVMIVALITAIGGTVLQIIGPDKLKDLTNEISKGLPALVKDVPVLGSIDFQTITAIAWSLVFLYAGSALLNLVQSFLMADATQKISRKMRTDISQKINRLPLRYFDRSSQGDVLSRVTNDVDTIGQTLNQSLGTLISSVTMLLGALVMMFLSNWILALITVLCSVLGFALMIIIMAKSQKYFSAQQSDLGAINGHVEETYTGHNVIKVYNGGKEAKTKFEEINEKLYASAWKSQFLSGLNMPLMSFIGNLGYVAVCVVGAVLAMNGTITFGVIVAFIFYVRLFTQPLSQIAQAFNNLQRTAAAGERVFAFLEEKELQDESGKAKQLTNVSGDVEFSQDRKSVV